MKTKLTYFHFDEVREYFAIYENILCISISCCEHEYNPITNNFLDVLDRLISNNDIEYVFVCNTVLEGGSFKFFSFSLKIKHELDNYKLNGDIKNYCIIHCDNWNDVDTKQLEKIDNIVFVHWLLLSTLQWSKLIKNKFSYHSTNEKILYMPGKLYKFHRIGLLYELYKRNMLYSKVKHSALLEASWYKEHSDTKNWYLDVQSELDYCYDNVDFKELFPYLENSLDVGLSRTLSVNNPIQPFWQNVYENVIAILVSETAIGQSAHLSEKTWWPIVLGYPFFHVDRHFASRLEFLNFKPFMEPMTKYDNVDPCNEIKIVVDRIEQFLKYIRSSDLYRKDILQKINHNQGIAESLYDEAIQKIKKYVPSIELDKRLLLWLLIVDSRQVLGDEFFEEMNIEFDIKYNEYVV